MSGPRGPRLIVRTTASPASPAPPVLPDLLPATPIAARPCADFAEWWFDLRCSGEHCRRSAGYPIKLLRERRHCRDETNVLLVARRFRCEACRSRPARVALCERLDRRPGLHHGGGADSAYHDLTALLGPEYDAAYNVHLGA